VPTLLHVSPHADDEALGAPATLLLLLRSGWRVVNVVTSLGGPSEHDRRRQEAIDAAARAGIDLVLPDGQHVEAGGGTGVEQLVATLVQERAPDVVVSPSPHDGHPRHVAVAGATGAALSARAVPPVWWQWGLWADLARPTLYVPFDDDVLADAQHVLAAYAGELARNDYSRLLTARAITHAVLGSERVFGYGAGRASSAPYAELLTELRWTSGAWHVSAARVLDTTDPLGSTAPPSDVSR
jgi:LmbE family N-acetylglucosaminyl deacetylase